MFSRILSRLRAAPWPFILVMAVAGVARLAAIDLIDYRYDEAVAVKFAFDIADGRWLALAPMSGSIATHPPLSLYVMAIPAMLARDPLWVASFRAALDVIGVGIVGWAASRAWGRVSGVVAALAYAVGPWAVYFARKTPVTSIGLFAAIALAGGLFLVVQRRGWGWPLAAFGVALALGSHLSSVYMLPGLVVVLLLGRRSLTWPVFLAGLAPLGLVALGYAAADAPGGFRNIQALLQAQGRPAGEGGLAMLDFALWQSSAAKLAEVVGLPALFAPERSFLDLANLLPQALLIFGIGLATARWLRNRSDAGARGGLAAAAFWLGIVLPQLRSGPAPQPHYSQMAMPAAFGLIGYSTGWLWALAKSARLAWLRLFMAGALLGMTLFDLAYTAGLNAAAMGDGPFPGYRPARVALAVAGAARTLAQGCQPGEIVIAAPGANPETDDQAAVFATLLADRRPRLFDGREAVLAPSGCAVWVLAPGPAPALAAFGVGGTGARRAVAPSAADAAGLGEWPNGITLLSARVSTGARAWATATLRVTGGAGASEDAHWFARLSAGGRQIASRDIGGVRPMDWRAGDTIGLWFDLGGLDVPAGEPVELRIGSYRYPEGSGIGVRLPDGSWVDAVSVRVTAP